MSVPKTSFEEFEGWLKQPETERLEFKKAENQFSRDKDLPDYCAALANEGGGKLILGVSNDRRVSGTKAFIGTYQTLANDLLHDLHIRIDVEQFDHPQGRVLIFHIPSRAPGTLVRSTGKYTYPMRAGESLVEMDTETIRRILHETESDFSAKIVPQFTLKDIDETAVDNFRQRWSKKQKRDDYRNYSIEKTLGAIGLLHDGGLSYAALVLFGKKDKIDSLLPDAEIIFEYRQDPGKTAHDFRKTWRAPFFKVFDEIWETINSRNIRFPYQDGLFQFEVYAYSEKPVREALLNAVAHRDYALTGRSIFIKISPEKFSVESPGGFPQGVSVENVLIKSVWRNRRIAEVFEKAGLVERSGQGMDDIFRVTISEGKGLPDFTGTDDYCVTLGIPARVKDPNFILFLEKVGKEKQISFSFEEIYELEHVREKQPVHSVQFKERFLENGIIQKIGKTSDTRYILAHEYYVFQGKPGIHTKLAGLSREQYKQLILNHLDKNKGVIREFKQALPALKAKEIANLLQELKREGKIKYHGAKKSGYWVKK